MEKKNFISVIALSAILIQARAQAPDSLRKVNLSEVNVVASKVEKNNSETPRNVTVITSDQLLQSGYTSMADVLSEAGSIYITGTGQNPGTNESIFMRGANSNQVVILIDGVRLSDASTVNNTMDLSELSLDDIDRIEIIRGPHSTLYGSAAVGGVVSITTKHGIKKGINANLSLSGGMFGKKTLQKEVDASLGYTFNNGLYLDGGISKILVDGLDATLDTVTDPSTFKNRDKDNWYRLNYHGGAGYHHDRLSMDFRIASTTMNTDLDKGAYADDNNYTLHFKRNLINGNIGWKLSNIFSTQLSAGYTDTKRHSVNDSSIVDAAGTFDHNYLESTYSGKYTTFDWQLNAHLEHADILAGISSNEEDMSQEDFYQSTAFGFYESKTKLDTITPARTTAVYLHADLNGALLQKLLPGNTGKVLEKYSLGFGCRYSGHSVTGTQLSYDATLGFAPEKNSLLYFSYSAGFNNPSLYQLYAPEKYEPWDGGIATGLTRGNKNLEAETSVSFEVGLKQKSGEHFRYNVSFFHSITDNLIEYAYLWNKDIGVDTLGNDWGRDDYRGDRYLNLGKQTTTGIELDIAASLNEKITIACNATLVSGTIEYNSSASIEEQTNGEHVQLYSNGAFLDSKTKAGSLVRRPSEANLKIIYAPCAKLYFTPFIRYVTSRYDIYYDGSLGPFGALATNVVDAYTLVGLSLHWNIRKWISLNLRGENLGNEKYEEIHGFSTRGRSIYATLSLRY